MKRKVCSFNASLYELSALIFALKTATAQYKNSKIHAHDLKL